MPTLVSFKLLFIEMTRSVLLMAVHLLVGKKKRTVFDHQRAANALDDDYLGIGVIPRFDDRQFELQFGINRARFTEIMLAIGHGGNKFFCQEYKSGTAGLHPDKQCSEKTIFAGSWIWK